jgi:hypothetical protein
VHKESKADGKAAKEVSQSREPNQLRPATRAYPKNNQQVNKADTKAASNETEEDPRARRQKRKEDRQSRQEDKAAVAELIEEKTEMAKFEKVLTIGKFFPINNY